MRSIRKLFTPKSCLSAHNFPKTFSSLAIHSDTNNLEVLTKTEKNFLKENGYLLLKNFVPVQVTKNLKSRIDTLLDEFDASTSKSIFKSHYNEKQYKDIYFLESGDKIRFFWEDDVFDENGKLKVDKKLAINKIGHALHILDPYFHSYVYGYLPSLTKDVGYKKPIPIQSMYITKQPGVGGEVSEHQDSTFLYTQPYSCYGFWLAIDDSMNNNGCIWVVPKSHVDQKVGLRNRFKRTNNEQVELISLIGDGKLSREGGIPVEAKSGDLLILHGHLVHWSDANTSEHSRHAYMTHFVDGTCDYPDDNWLQYPDRKFPQFKSQDFQNQHNVREKVSKEIL